MQYQKCPFYCTDYEEIRNALMDMPLQDLIFYTESALDMLSPTDRMVYDIHLYVHDFSDRQGRIEFLRRIIEDELVIPLMIPHFIHKSSKIGDLISKKEDLSFLFPEQEAETQQAEPEVLTDDLAIITGTVEVSNSRWEHKDSAKKQSTPEKASFGDTIILMADIKNFPEGGPVTFDIYDTSVSPAQLVDSAKGKNEKGVGKGEWVVTDKSGKGTDQTLAFEAVVRSKASEKKEIAVEAKEFVFSF